MTKFCQLGLYENRGFQKGSNWQDKTGLGGRINRITHTCSSSKEYSTYTWGPLVSGNSWDEIFYQISPLMIHEADDLQLRRSLNSLIRNEELEIIKEKESAKGHRFKDFSIKEEDFQTIKVQLRALGLINKSVKNRSVKDTKTYWALTPYGDSVMNRLRAIETK